jgi:hypothetical protein
MRDFELELGQSLKKIREDVEKMEKTIKNFLTSFTILRVKQQWIIIAMMMLLIKHLMNH